MAAKKKAKSKTKVSKKTRAAGKVENQPDTTGKAVAKTAKTLLGRVAQRSAQLILASGILGEVPKRPAAAKKRPRKK